MIEVVVARPAVPRSHDRQGRRAARHRHRALLPRPPAPAARVRQPRRRGRRRRRRAACSRSIRRPKGCRSRSSASIIDAHLDALLPLVTEYLPRDVLATARRAAASATRCAWCTGPTSIAEAMQGRARLAFEELFFVQLLHQRAKALARERARGHHVREQARAHDAAARGAAVPAHRRAGARDARDRRRHVQRPPHAPAAAGRRRQRQDDRRAVRRAARDGERLPGGDHGADRAARRAARAHDDASCSRRSASRRCS